MLLSVLARRAFAGLWAKESITSLINTMNKITSNGFPSELATGCWDFSSAVHGAGPFWFGTKRKGMAKTGQLHPSGPIKS